METEENRVPSADIYGQYRQELTEKEEEILARIKNDMVYEHILGRIKTDQSMRDKCRRRGLPETAEAALTDIKDAIGIRIVCGFMEDIYEDVRRIHACSGCTVDTEKDYIRNVKPNGYRSYHIILKIPGSLRPFYYAEIQLRTIAMDSWASLEHRMKYKKRIQNQDIAVRELKRCADELAACDVSMQTIREWIEENTEDENTDC